MCGRVYQPTEYSEIKIKLRFDDQAPAPNLRPSRNIAPTQDLLIAVHDPKRGTRRPGLVRWGLLPYWAKDQKLSFSTFNARAEGFTAKPAFRSAWQAGRRCLVITSGFYEWKKPEKQPFAIEVTDGPFTILAGLWDSWKSPQGERINSCTIITTDANELVAPLHDRMPVIPGEEDWPKWLGEEPASDEELLALLKPYPADRMKRWPVTRAMGNVRIDGPHLIEPIALGEAA